MTIAAAPGWGQRLGALALLLLVVVSTLYLVVDHVLVARYRFYLERLEQQQGRLEQLERMAASREPIAGESRAVAEPAAYTAARTSRR